MKPLLHAVPAALILSIAAIELPALFIAAGDMSEPTRMHFVATNDNDEDDWK